MIAALFFKSRLRLAKAAPAAWLSTALGFVVGWGAAIYGKNSEQMDWLYNAPAISLIVAVLVFVLVSMPFWKPEGVKAL